MTIHPPHPTPAVRRTSTALLVTTALTLIASCGGQEPGRSPTEFGHVHGLGVNPADEKLYVATHAGVFAVENETARLIANRRQDTMGFTVVGPDQFLGSGHPASLDEPNPLGLIKSDDAAKTWSAVAFAGKQDFHAIDTNGRRIYAYSASDAALLHSRDGGNTWETVARNELLDIAADPSDADHVLGSESNGAVISYRVGTEPVRIENAPALNTIDWQSEGQVVGTGVGGKIWVSSDAGQTWASRGDLPGTAEAISVKSATWYAATAAGVYESSDRGRNWTSILENR